MKQFDVYSFRFKEDVAQGMFSPYHCFDGQLVCCKRGDGTLYLADTYWSSPYDNFQGGGDRRIYTLKQAEERGVLTFKCNLEEVEKIHESDLVYFNDEDIINLSHQHNCYKYYAVKKGTQRSKTKMIQSATEKLQDAIRTVNMAERKIIDLHKTIEQIEAGNLEVYIY